MPRTCATNSESDDPALPLAGHQGVFERLIGVGSMLAFPWAPHGRKTSYIPTGRALTCAMGYGIIDL
jgi:hypothetical protein